MYPRLAAEHILAAYVPLIVTKSVLHRLRSGDIILYSVPFLLPFFFWTLFANCMLCIIVGKFHLRVPCFDQQSKIQPQNFI